MAFVAAVYVFLQFFPHEYAGPSAEEKEYVTMTGVVAGKEYKTSYEGESVPVLYLKDAQKSDVKVQVYLEDCDTDLPEMGETVRIAGKYAAFSIARNPGEFNSRQYYQILKIEYQVKDAKITARNGDGNALTEGLYRCKVHLSCVLDQSLNEEDASIMKAMLLGDRTSMEEEIKDLYQMAGIIHILSISGLHISILGMGLYKLLRKGRLRILPAAVLAILVMCGYGVMCGMGSSAVRAIIMFILRLLATVIGRTYDMLTGLSIAAFLLLLEQPLYIYHSGFLMSFGAVLGISLLLPTFPKGEKMPVLLRRVWDTVRVSLSVSFFTLPVLMNTYYTFPVYSILLNILVLPFMTILLAAGLIVLAAGSILTGLGALPGNVCHFILYFYRELCVLNQKLPGAVWYTGHAAQWQIVVYFAVLFAYLLIMLRMQERTLKENIKKESNVKGHCEKASNAKEYFEKESNAKVNEKKGSDGNENSAKNPGWKRWIPGALYCLLPAAVLILAWRDPPSFRMTFLHVGQGDGIVLEMGERHYLIDGGSTSNGKVGQYVLEPFLKYEGIGYLDAVIVTHEDTDHVSGILTLLEDMQKGGIKIGSLLLPDCAAESRGENYAALELAAQNAQVPVAYISRGDSIATGDKTITIDCIGPQKGIVTEGANAHSTVLFVKNGDFTALLTGDVDGEGLSDLTSVLTQDPETYEDLTLLKVPHHGSKYTTDEAFLNALRPRCSVISCGEDNRYGHPHEDTLERLERVQSPYYITWQTGAVIVEKEKETTMTFYLQE